MDCGNIQDKLSAYVDEELSREEKSQIDGHLNACSKCSLALEDLRKTIALTRSIETTEPPPWLRQKVMARVRDEATQKKGIIHKLFFPLHIKVPVEIFATLAIAITAFYVFKTVEPEIKQPASISTPSADIHDTEKVEELKQGRIPAQKERSAEAPPAPAKRMSEAEESVFTAGKVKEAVSLNEEKAASEGLSGEADFRMKKELRTLAPGVMMKAGEAEKQVLGMTVFVKDTLNLNEEMEKTVKKLGGGIIRSESVDNKLLLTITLNSGKLKELKDALKLLGEVEEETAIPSAEGDIEIIIKVVKTEVRLH